ncbi:MAG: helix-turn-helix transcriptional regulator [Bacteroidota bacterium]
MHEPPKHIKFQNRQNPRSGFDLVDYEYILNYGKSDHSPFRPHIIEFFNVFLIQEGDGKHSIDFIDYPFERGTLFTIRKDQIHWYHQIKEAKGKILIFTYEFLGSHLEKQEGLKTLQLFNEFLGVPKIQLSATELNEINQLIERMSKEYFIINDHYSLEIIRSELLILLAKLYRIKSANNQVIGNRRYLSEFIVLQRLVEQNVVKTLRVKDYASMMGLSTKTLNTITQNIINKSAKAFIDEICATQIKRLLINTDLSIKEIAYQTGFEETTNFYKYFKRQTNTTPERFRSSKQ